MIVILAIVSGALVFYVNREEVESVEFKYIIKKYV